MTVKSMNSEQMIALMKEIYFIGYERGFKDEGPMESDFEGDCDVEIKTIRDTFGFEMFDYG